MNSEYYEEISDEIKNDVKEGFKKMKTWQLKDGTKFTHISKHGFKFSDGSECDEQDVEIVRKFSMDREFIEMYRINNMPVSKSTFIVTEEMLTILDGIENTSTIDLIIVPYPMISALLDLGVRHKYKKVVAYNATFETRREPNPNNKIVDINNWAY